MYNVHDIPYYWFKYLFGIYERMINEPGNLESSLLVKTDNWSEAKYAALVTGFEFGCIFHLDAQ